MQIASSKTDICLRYSKFLARITPANATVNALLGENAVHLWWLLRHWNTCHVCSRILECLKVVEEKPLILQLVLSHVAIVTWSVDYRIMQLMFYPAAILNMLSQLQFPHTHTHRSVSFGVIVRQIYAVCVKPNCEAATWMRCALHGLVQSPSLVGGTSGNEFYSEGWD